MRTRQRRNLTLIAASLAAITASTQHASHTLPDVSLSAVSGAKQAGMVAIPMQPASVAPLIADRAEIDRYEASRSFRRSETPSTTSTTSIPPRPAPRPVPVAQPVARPVGSLLGRFYATCYGPPTFYAGKHTATGHPVGSDTIAVDPRVIPLGTRVTVEGLGARIAADTGGAIKGNHIDVWLSTCPRGWGNHWVSVWR